MKLGLRFFLYDGVGTPLPECVLHEIISTALANKNLQVLDLVNDNKVLNLEPHLESLFSRLNDHQGLRTIKVMVRDEAFGPDFSLLRVVLEQNRNLTVVDEADAIYGDELIDSLYGLNYFYQGSAELAIEPSPERSTLVATALAESASNNFQRSSLLLSDHVDVLCEIIWHADLDVRGREGPSPQPKQGNLSRRRSREQSPRTAKRVSRRE